MLQKKENEKLTVLADKGFDTGSELKACAENNITTIVAVKKRLSYKKNKALAKNKFYFDEKKNEYHCPENQVLKSNGIGTRKKPTANIERNINFNDILVL